MEITNKLRLRRRIGSMKKKRSKKWRRRRINEKEKSLRKEEELEGKEADPSRNNHVKSKIHYTPTEKTGKPGLGITIGTPRSFTWNSIK